MDRPHLVIGPCDNVRRPHRRIVLHGQQSQREVVPRTRVNGAQRVNVLALRFNWRLALTIRNLELRRELQHLDPQMGGGGGPSLGLKLFRAKTLVGIPNGGG